MPDVLENKKQTQESEIQQLEKCRGLVLGGCSGVLDRQRRVGRAGVG
jgi:hypothetical protein